MLERLLKSPLLHVIILIFIGFIFLQERHPSFLKGPLDGISIPLVFSIFLLAWTKVSFFTIVLH
jgi:hypothetical protein